MRRRGARSRCGGARALGLAAACWCRDRHAGAHRPRRGMIMTNDCERCGQSDDWFRTCAECAKRVCIDCLNPWSLKTDGDLCTVCARPLLPEWHPAKDHKACVTCGAALFDNHRSEERRVG